MTNLIAERFQPRRIKAQSHRRREQVRRVPAVLGLGCSPGWRPANKARALRPRDRPLVLLKLPPIIAASPYKTSTPGSVPNASIGLSRAGRMRVQRRSLRLRFR